MAAGEAWSDGEVREVVHDYMSMLKQALAGQPYNKARHRRTLLPRLSGRTAASVEFKHRNISAVLRDMGHLWVPGYLPAANYQKSIAAAVASWLEGNPDFENLATQAVERHAVAREDIDLDALLADTSPPPRRKDETDAGRLADAPRIAVPIRRDYVAIEAANRSLGLAGERLVVELERHRLRRLGLERLARRVEHVAVTQGDGCGFDVLSFHPDGREHFVEVKTTAFAPEVPFFASPAEVRFSERHAPQFSVFRVHSFRQAPRFFALPGAIGDHCVLDAASFRCRLR